MIVNYIFYGGQKIRKPSSGVLVTHRMPLPLGNFWDLNKEPLACRILETRFDDPQFHGSTRMYKNFGQRCCPSSTIFPVHPFAKVDNTRPNGEPPAFVAKTVLRRVEGESISVVRICRVADKAPSGMAVKANEEEEGEVMSVPKSFETLVADLVVCSGIHEDHDEEHEMASYTTSLCIVNLQCILRTNLCKKLITSVNPKFTAALTSAFDVEKVDIMSCSMYHCPKCHRICDLSMEPDVLVGREEPRELGTNDANDIAQHGDQEQSRVERKSETSTTRRPDRPFQTIESSQFSVSGLLDA